MSYDESKLEEEKKKQSQTPKQANKVIEYLKTLKTGDKLGYATVLITLVFGFWGIYLTNKIIDTSIDIKHFDTLLNKTDSSLSDQAKLLSANSTLISLSQKQIDSLVSINKTLTKQFGVLSKQYAISLDEQKLSNSNKKNTDVSDEAKFYLAVQNLHLLLWQRRNPYVGLSEWTMESKSNFLNKVNDVLNGQLNNPYLLSNSYMLEDWVSVRDSIFLYVADINFLPVEPKDTLTFGGMTYAESQKILKDEWRNCFIAIANLSHDTDFYMMYYRRRHLDGSVKKPPPIFYKQILLSRKKL